MNEETIGALADQVETKEAEILNPEADVVEVPAAGPSWWSQLLTAKTGPGSIESYSDHPMNWNHTNPVSRILRGLTGLIGNLDLAIADIGIGLVELLWKKPAPAPAPVGHVEP